MPSGNLEKRRLVMMRIRTSVIATVAMACLVALIPSRPALSHADLPVNPFAGSWAGPYTFIPDGFDGELSFTVTEQGVTEGVFGPVGGPPAGTFQGVTLSDGSYHAVGHGSVPGPGSSGQPVIGTVWLDSNGHMLMEFGPPPGDVIDFTGDMAPQ
jgi:hypothetical protein